MIKATLIQNASGKFRPAIPEPANNQEAPQYSEVMEVARDADHFYAKAMHLIENAKNLDNRPDDFNSTEGLVVTHGTSGIYHPVFETLKFEPKTGEPESYDRIEQGFVRWDETQLEKTQTFKYLNEPLLQVEYELRDVLPDSSKVVHFETRNLTEIKPGVFEYSEVSRDDRGQL